MAIGDVAAVLGPQGGSATTALVGEGATAAAKAFAELAAGGSRLPNRG